MLFAGSRSHYYHFMKSQPILLGKECLSTHNLVKLMFTGFMTAAAVSLFAQVYTPSGSVAGATTTPSYPFSGVGLNSPESMLEIKLHCVSDSSGMQGGLVVTDDNTSLCASPMTKGNHMIYVREKDVSGENPFFTVRRSTGFTGIGVLNPAAQLEIKSTAGYVNPFQVTGYSGSLNLLVDNKGRTGLNTQPAELLHVHDGVIRITGANQHGGPMVMFGGVPNDPNNAPSGQWGLEYMPTDGGLNFWRPYLSHDDAGTPTVGANYVMFLNNDNRVGIHTNKPLQDFHVNGKVYIGSGSPNFTTGYKLYVEEGILTESVRVQLQSNWPDYVFEDQYPLRDLDEVQDFITANNHLPGIPSAAQVAAEGIDLGAMDGKLLEKIEELTLYMIALKEQNELLTSELVTLKQRVVEIQK